VNRRTLWLALAFAMAMGACRPGSPPFPSRSPVPRLARHVVLISLDGFRADYMTRPAAKHLRAIATRGVRAERMIPVFPSKTFPNHYSVVTGLTAEQHGIVANAMRDSVLGRFTTRDTIAQSESRWWGGEPIWVTAERQGIHAASVSWPGSEAAIKGVRPTWWQRYWHEEPAASKIGKVLQFLQLPADSAPGIITLYFHDVDTDSHDYGPDSPETDAAIARVDSAVGALDDGIARMGLRDQVTLIVVSDHGMTPVSGDRQIVLDDYIDLTTIDVIDWSPVGAIVPRDGDVERVYRALQGKHPHLQVYKKGDVPARWHFNDNPRITPIVLVADEGWSITSRESLRRRAERGITQWGGAHGYDPALPSMGALFIAAGPGIAQGKVVAPFQNVHVYSLMTHLLGLTPAPTSGSLDSVRTMLR
jgi:predicted AlkP superfamily pyrophosphatase or phosphodiesterase